ncbi:MAG: hypothetical protein OXC37_03965, partial [Bdellovibrionaceae bacterium]|nr:hypothetical protein [Pseudobdellovibrionaceae bacterium]
EKGIPLLNRGFESDSYTLKLKALSSMRSGGEQALLLLNKGFASNVKGLQLATLSSARRLGEQALPLLKTVLKDQNLDKEMRRLIKRAIAYLE